MRKNISPVLLCATALLTLAGCRAVGPDYQAPLWTEPDVSDLGTHAGETLDLTESLRWWRVFDDPALTNLVERALLHNLTLADSLARLREARARLSVSRAGLLPEVDAAGAWQRYRNSDNGGMPGSGDLYRAGFDARWELDIFGRRRRSIEESRADFAASCATYENVRVVVAAETALAYVSYREFQQRIRVAEANREIQRDTLEILESRVQAGIGDALAVEQAKYNLERTRAAIPGLRSASEEALNGLAVLTGAMPGALTLDVGHAETVLSAPLRALTGIPAATLRNRPDIRAAERRLAARCAAIGVAEADLYPTFALGGSIGLESLDSGDLLDGGSRFYALGPSFTWPIFRAGSIRANIEVRKALYDQALAEYEKTVLEAAAELRNAMSAYVQEYQRLDALIRAADAARSAVEISQDQYRQGLADFNSVLDAQRSLLTFEELIVTSRALIVRDLIGIYKALGGGWQPLSAAP